MLVNIRGQLSMDGNHTFNAAGRSIFCIYSILKSFDIPGRLDLQCCGYLGNTMGQVFKWPCSRASLLSRGRSSDIFRCQCLPVVREYSLTSGITLRYSDDLFSSNFTRTCCLPRVAGSEPLCCLCSLSLHPALWASSVIVTPSGSGKTARVAGASPRIDSTVCFQPFYLFVSSLFSVLFLRLRTDRVLCIAGPSNTPDVYVNWS